MSDEELSQASEVPSEASQASSEHVELPETLLRILNADNNYALIADPTKNAVEIENESMSLFQRTKRGNQIDLATTSANMQEQRAAHAE